MTATDKSVGLYHFKIKYWDSIVDNIVTTEGITAATSCVHAANIIGKIYKNIFEINELHETFVLIDKENLISMFQ